MNHWYVQGRLGMEHRADLDREADRAGLAKAVLVEGLGRYEDVRAPAARPPDMRDDRQRGQLDHRAWQSQRRLHSYVSVMTAWADQSVDR